MNQTNTGGSALLEQVAEDVTRMKALTTFVERHVHSPERAFGQSADQSGNNWAADNLTAYQVVSGNGDYGSDVDDEALVIGSDDTPTKVVYILFDLHKITITNISSASVYKLRIIYGTGTMAQAITAGTYSEFVFKLDTLGNIEASFPVDFQMEKVASGTKVWMQCKNATDNATVDFFVALHEYLPE